MYISPRHRVSELPHYEKWGIDLKINIFQDSVDGWHLEVADRCINGWKNEAGQECIVSTHLNGDASNQIPDSGWAVLQIVLNYFEVVAYFKLNCRDRPQERFKQGFLDVFPGFRDNAEEITNEMYLLRNTLYHTGIGGSKILLAHGEFTPPLIYFDNVIQIDPHRFVPVLRAHLQSYCQMLRDKNNIELRNNFLKAFEEKYNPPETARLTRGG